jgi:malate synthase
MKILGALKPAYREILTDDALQFLAALTQEFRGPINELLAARELRQAEIDAGKLPDFPGETAKTRAAEWRVRKAPPDLTDRRVEIIVPTERKAIVDALNSGARVLVADCEDSLSPTWDNVIGGQVNLRDAVNRSIEFDVDGKQYALNESTATLVVRPRSLHLDERHLICEGEVVPAVLVDFGLYLFHNAGALKERGTGPYFCLPKLEGRHEARLWADILRFAESRGIVESGATRVTVMIETILAAFEMDEILYELRDFVAGLQCGRRDYVFSFIKTFRAHSAFVLPDRSEVTMASHFLRSCSLLAIRTCHRRGSHAIGGMAAQLPVTDDRDANETAFARVRADKEREARDGHDGTWVAHPSLVPVVTEVFDRHMAGPNQLNVMREDINVTAADLLQGLKGKITERGVRDNIREAILYMAAWLEGQGCVPVNHVVAHAATAEIARAQLWQWVHHATGILDEGRNVTLEFVRQCMREEMDRIRDEVGDTRFNEGKFREAAGVLDRMTQSAELPAFLTTELYDALP